MTNQNPSAASTCGRFGSPSLSRREMLERSAIGFGSVALSSMMLQESYGATTQSVGASVVNPHLNPTATSIIFLFMGGGPSQVDTFDPKPELTKLNGQETPKSIQNTFLRTATMGNGTRKLMASPFTFKQYGECGQPVSSLFPATAQHVDDLCIIRSMQHDTIIHQPGEYVMTTGTILGDRPSLGAWVTYGLGTVNQDIPGYVVMGKPRHPTFSSGFLPARFQGTNVEASGIRHLTLPDGVTVKDRRQQLDLISALNRIHQQRIDPVDSEWDARIRSYELTFRMQAEAPAAFDLSQETAETKTLYGIDGSAANEVGTQCLLARRLVERGVRFVQIYVGGWDSHSDLKGGHAGCADRSDRPVAGLLADLKRRGLLDSTLVVWGGEFGRTPGAEKGNGRDHSAGGFTVWLAGGGTRGGQTIGRTDAVGYTAIERPIHPNSLHATMLHALGIDQEQLYFLHNGRREIPTFVYSEVVKDAFA